MMLATVRASARRAKASRSVTRRAAFTLLEVLVVVAILVILAGAASIAIFRYMEDAKVGRAKNDMRIIEQAYKKYYMEHGSWPQAISEVAPQIEQGQAGLLDPWGQPYSVSIAQVQQTDGEYIQRPVVNCQPPGGKPPIQWPEK